MPVERRLREGTQRNASVIDGDVDRVLGTVIRRGRRRAILRRSISVAVAIPVVVGGLVLGQQVLGSPGNVRPATGSASTPAPTPTPAASAIGGTFTRTLRADRAVVRANGIAGTWTLGTDPDGRTRLQAPPSFAGAAASRPFVVQGNELRTDAFAGDLCRGLRAGTYTWTRAGSYLVLTAVSDPCDARAWILSSGPWRLR